MGQLTSRQEILSMEVNDYRMRNWLCANMALRETSQAIAVFLHRQIAEVHKTMQNSILPSTLCSINCSQRLERNGPQGWCAACERWATEIQRQSEPYYNGKLNFTRLNSSQWPVNPYECARAYIPRAHRLYYKAAEFHEDLRFSLSFIENSTAISIPKGVCENVWQCRGKLKRKNTRMRLGSQDMQEIISSFLQLLSHLDIGSSADTVKSRLEALQQGSLEEENHGCEVM